MAIVDDDTVPITIADESEATSSTEEYSFSREPCAYSVSVATHPVRLSAVTATIANVAARSMTRIDPRGCVVGVETAMVDLEDSVRECATMKARSVVSVDYLDSYSPRLYRVYFWEKQRVDYAYNLDAWDLLGCADAAEALAWAAAHANARLYQVFAVAPDSGGDAECLVVLYGRDPNIPELD